MSGKRQLLRAVGTNVKSLSRRVYDTSADVTAVSRCTYDATTSTQLSKCPFQPAVADASFNAPSIDVIPPAQITRGLAAIPGPQPFPLIGTMYQYFPGGQLYGMPWYDKLAKLQELYGDVVHEAVPGGLHIVHLYNPDDFLEVFRNEGKYPTRDSFFMLRRFNNKYNDGVHGIITSSGESWQKKRSKIQGKIAKPKSVRTYLPGQNPVADDFITFLRHTRNKEDIVEDLLSDLYRYATESIAVVCFNKRLGALEINSKPGSEAEQFINSVNDVLMATQSEMGSLPLYNLYDTPMFKQLSKAQSYINEVTIKNAREAIEYCKSKEIHEDDDEEANIPTFLNKSSLTDKESFTLIGDFFFGGVDTTSNLIGFVMYNLCKNPSKMAILRQEIDEVIGQAREITSENFERLPYLKAVIKESLRVTPVSAGNLRTLATEATFSGYDVPAGTMVVLHNEWVGKQAQYVPNPDEFIPERWLRNGKYPPIHPHVLLPFGFGPRSCPGRRVAEQEASLCLIKVLQNFDIEYCHSEDMKCEMRIINKIITPLKFRFSERGRP
ncbi:probable cytochrome P450 12a5, mitochondrial [Patella vulgata]|uniref:probable cytochrome P450 12a5, mitochondrial n=1 Tax=Patella vulgata TaxID=6465 RepID=UPI00217FE066|nr:probable cytochrome P450 12a5, mitochondrial [Patella vulgata]